MLPATGRVNASPWTRIIPSRYRSFRAALSRWPHLSRQTAGELGPGAADRGFRSGSDIVEEEGSLWHILYPLEKDGEIGLDEAESED